MTHLLICTHQPPSSGLFSLSPPHTGQSHLGSNHDCSCATAWTGPLRRCGYSKSQLKRLCPAFSSRYNQMKVNTKGAWRGEVVTKGQPGGGAPHSTAVLLLGGLGTDPAQVSLEYSPGPLVHLFQDTQSQGWLPGTTAAPNIRHLLRNLHILLFCSVQSLSGVWCFEIPWSAGCQASLSFTISQSLAKFMLIESVMLSHPLPPHSPIAFKLALQQGLFQWIDSLH